MKKYIFIFFVASLYQYTNAQVTGEVNVLDRDLFYVHFTPETEISDDISYQKTSTKLSFPLIRGHKFSIFNTLGLDIHDFNSENNELLTNTDEIDRFYNVGYSLFMNYKLSEKWSLNALLSPFVSSDLEDSFSFDALKFNGNIFAERIFFRKKGGYFQLGFGVGYMTLNGTTQVNPIVQLKSRLNEKWSFALGLPNTYLKWDFHKNHSLKVMGDLNDFYADLNNNSGLLTNAQADKIVFTTASIGLEYNYWLTSSLGIMVKGSYPVWGNYEIKDSDDNTLYEFDTSFEKPFIGVGIKFNPIRSLQNSLSPL